MLFGGHVVIGHSHLQVSGFMTKGAGHPSNGLHIHLQSDGLHILPVGQKVGCS